MKLGLLEQSKCESKEDTLQHHFLPILAKQTNTLMNVRPSLAP
jgi:hypothetical protein